MRGRYFDEKDFIFHVIQFISFFGIFCGHFPGLLCPSRKIPVDLAAYGQLLFLYVLEADLCHPPVCYHGVVVYFGAFGREKHGTGGGGSKWIVLLFSVFCFALLFYFKYLNFFCDSLNFLFDRISFLPDLNIPFFDIVLPVGISFHTFQNVGYQLDVYRKEIPAEHHFGYFALFSSYFPQLVAGPIERTANLLPQLKQVHKFTYENGSQGLRMVLIGLFKKVAVADTIAIYVDTVYNNLSLYTGLPLILATVLFAFQIYCDFSGYSDIAFGVSKMLGINLMRNFESPYLAQSISEFWHRWHISLSTWFRDNVYIPLGGSRVKLPKHLRNLMITFVLSGMWHGASWNFFIWGALHGAFLCLEVLYRKWRHLSKADRGAKSIWGRALRMLFVFIIVDFAWIFFRANHFSDAIYVIDNMFRGLQFGMEYLKASLLAMGFTKDTAILVFLLMVILWIIDICNGKKHIEIGMERQKTWLRWTEYVALTAVVILCIMFTSQSQNFIYFQF